MDARIARSMERRGELTEALKAIKNVADDESWFRDTPHYWAKASLPLAYAGVCVEVVSKSLESELHSMRARMDTTKATRTKKVSSLRLTLLE